MSSKDFEKWLRERTALYYRDSVDIDVNLIESWRKGAQDCRGFHQEIIKELVEALEQDIDEINRGNDHDFMDYYFSRSQLALKKYRGSQ